MWDRRALTYTPRSSSIKSSASHSRTWKNCCVSSRSMLLLNPPQHTSRPWVAFTFFITPPSASSTVRSMGLCCDFTCTQMRGSENPNVPGAARMSMPPSGPGGLMCVLKP